MYELIVLIIIIIIIIIIRFSIIREKEKEKKRKLLETAIKGWAYEIAVEQDSKKWNNSKHDRGEMRINEMERLIQVVSLSNPDKDLRRTILIISKVIKKAREIRSNQ